MGKYVRKSHGITIGGERNGFFVVRDRGLETQRVQTYSAIVTIEGYGFSQVNTANVSIRTPAQQLVWVSRAPTKAEALRDPFCRATIAPTRLAQGWLDRNAPGWGLQAVPTTTDSTIFFARRNHAVAFHGFIASLLDGMRFERDPEPKQRKGATAPAAERAR